MGNVYSDSAFEMSWHNVAVGGWYKMIGQNDYSNNVDCSNLDLTGTPRSLRMPAEFHGHGNFGI